RRDGRLQRVLRPCARLRHRGELDRRHAAPAWRRVGSQRAGRGRPAARLHQEGRSPISLQHFAESAVRAYKIAMTPPMMPVLLVADGGLQEDPIPAERPRIPKLTLTLPPQGDSNAVGETARLLVAAETPLLVGDRLARTPAGMMHLVELAELLQAPVVDQGGRMNFPSRHALNHSDRSRELVGAADVILGLELTDFWGTVDAYRDQLHRTSRPIAK